MSPEQKERLVTIIVGERFAVLRVIRRRKVDPAYEHDLAQDVLIKAITAIRTDRLVINDDLDARSLLRAWLFEATWRLVSEWKRNPRRRREEITPEHPGGDPVAHMEAREELRMVGYRLNRDERRMLDAIARGVSLAEYGRAEGVPIGTVCARIWRVRRVLKKRLGRE